MIFVSLFTVIAYIILNNVSIMSNNLEYNENSKELNKNLQDKAEINLRATIEYYLN
jgi:hypothetical protein